jgi:hypothetical protein
MIWQSHPSSELSGMPGSLEQFGKDLTAAGLMTAAELKTLVTGLPTGERP